jgi:hypothetical protein
MRGDKGWLFLGVILSVSCLLQVPNLALAYIGPGPGLELIPSFYSLLVWVGLALVAVLLWPAGALLRHCWDGQQRVPGTAEQHSHEVGSVGDEGAASEF